MDLQPMKLAFNKVGWFIPPYLQLQFLGAIQRSIETTPTFSQQNLEDSLSVAYTPEHLATMLCERYSKTPYVQEYKQIIGEAIEAHCGGLTHAAVLGLIPVIEGVGRKLLDSRGLKAEPIKDVFITLADDCKQESISKGIGMVDEVIPMLDAFKEFAVNYSSSQSRQSNTALKTIRTATVPCMVPLRMAITVRRSTCSRSSAASTFFV
jgi:hypothetical protein